jgi:hypothetical protein
MNDEDDAAAVRATDAAIAREMGRIAKRCGQLQADPEVVGESIARAIEAQEAEEKTPTVIVRTCEACGAIRKT